MSPDGARELLEMLAELEEDGRQSWVDPFAEGQQALDRLGEAMRCAASEANGSRQD